MQFGEPETWGMKVGEFLEKKETLLPQEKPQELLDIQEQNRKSRILDALNKIGGGMESSSRELIERENFNKGSEAAREYFKNRPIDKPTPVFEGNPGKLVGVRFKDKAQEKAYKELLKQRYSVPKGSKQKVPNEAFMKKFGISFDTMERVNRQLAKELNLKHPTQTYEGREKIVRARDKLRKENIRKISSTGMEDKIKRQIKKVNPDALAKEVDVAHRASLKANANLGADYLTTSLGLDKKIVNQSLVRPTEQKLGKLYDDQQKLIKGLKPGEVPKDVQKKIEKLNMKISELSDRTKGVLQGVLVDEKTLKPSVYGIDYSKVLGAGLIDKPVKDLSKADLDLIKLQVPEQIKAAKKVKPSLFSEPRKKDFVGLGSNLGIGKALGTAAEVAGSPAAAVVLAMNTIKSNMEKGQSFADAVVDPMTGLDLMFPGLASKAFPKVMQGILGLGKVGRAFTPVGAGIALLGQGQEFYNQYKDLQEMKVAEPEKYQQFIDSRIDDPLTDQERTEIEDMGSTGA